MKNSSCMMFTIYSLLIDYCRVPFEFNQEKFGQPISFVVDKQDQVKITHDLESVYFFYLDFLIFTIGNEDSFNLKSGAIEITTEHGHLTLKRL